MEPIDPLSSPQKPLKHSYIESLLLGVMTKKKKLFLIIFLIFALLITGVSFWIGLKGTKTDDTPVYVTPSPAPVVSEAPTPTDTPEPTDTPVPTKKLTSTPTKTPTPTTVPNTPTAVPTPKVTTVNAAVTPNSSTTCPTNFKFSGTMTTDRATTVTYQWERSDATLSDTKTETFSGAETKVVTIEWEKNATTSGWLQLHVRTPNSIDSNRAEFTLNCQ